MDFITSDIKKLYGKYLITSWASAVVMSIYSFVDSIAVEAVNFSVSFNK